MVETKPKLKMLIGAILTIIVLLSSILVARLFKAPISIAADEVKVAISASFDKYVNYNLSETDKGTLVQYSIKTGIAYDESQSYIPVRQSEINVNLSQVDGKYPSGAKVISKNKELTNESSYAYDSKTGKLIITANNQNENGEAIISDGNKNARDEYIVICYYDTYTEQKPEREIGFNVVAKNVLFAEENNEVSKDGNLKVKVDANVGELTSIQYYTDDVYNGYIKSNTINGTKYTTTYKETAQITVSKKEAQDKVEFKESNDDVIYKNTKIRKSDIQSILGEEGVLQVLDAQGNVLVEINKDTEFAEDGTVTIEYKDTIDAIVIKTSKVLNEGVLRLENTKEIKAEAHVLSNTEIKTTNELVGIKETKVAENKVEIKDAQTVVDFALNSENWTNERQNELTFEVKLNSNGAKYNMFQNPSIRIDLPSEVEKVILGDSAILYGNGLTLNEENKAEVIENEDGSFSIVVNIEGAQTTYVENELGLTTSIKIPATVILKKDIESMTSNVNLAYTNEYEKFEDKNIEKQIKLTDYKEESTAASSTEIAAIFGNTNTSTITVAEVEKIEGLQLEVVPVRGDEELKDGDTVYEGEFIKYNIKVTNTSDKDIENVKVVGTIPEGTTYGELDADYNMSISSGQRKYSKHNFDENMKTKTITIDTLTAGHTVTGYYEVKVNSLESGMTEKQIKSINELYVGDSRIQKSEMTHVVKKAEYNVYLSSASQNRDIGLYNYEVSIEGGTEEVTLKMQLPKGVQPTYYWAKDSGFKSPRITDIPEDNIFTMNLNPGVWVIQVSVDQTKIARSVNSLNWDLSVVATINDKYKSNENTIPIELRKLVVTMTSENEGEEIKYGEEINYEINVSLIGRTYEDEFFNTVSIVLTDYLPDYVEPVSVTYVKEGEEVTENIEIKHKRNGEDAPNVNLNLQISQDESPLTIKVKTLAGDVDEKIQITNNATAEVDVGQQTEEEQDSVISTTDILAQTSNTITHTILPIDYDDSDEPDDPENPDEPDIPENPNNPVVPSNTDDSNDSNNPNTSNSDSKYNISGVAWLDENEDGQRQTDEKLLSGITAMLVDMNNTEAIKEKVTTNSNGVYNFSSINTGNYLIVFKFDTGIYKVTEYQKNGVPTSLNSDATEDTITLNGEQQAVGVTDAIELNANISNIDIGLIQNKSNNLKIDKYITSVTVTTNKGTKNKTYNNVKLAKAEIKAKEIEGAKVTVKYKIVVTNAGEATSKIGQVVDSIPNGFEFVQSSNAGWSNKKAGELTNTSLSNKDLKPGESAEVTLILTKNMTASSTGTFTNTAKIENNSSTADVIVSISTGAIIYISIAIILVIIGILTFLCIKFEIYKKINVKKLSIFVVACTVILVEGTYQVNAEYFYWLSSGYHSNDDGSICFSMTGYSDAVHCAHDEITPLSGNYGSPTWVTSVSWGAWSAPSGHAYVDLSNNENAEIHVTRSGNNYVFGPFTLTCSDNEGWDVSVYDNRSGTKQKINGWAAYNQNNTRNLSASQLKRIDDILHKNPKGFVFKRSFKNRSSCIKKS